MKKFFRILFFVFASFFAVACSSSSSDETETNISEQSDSDGENSEHKSEDASGAADVKFENQSLYSVSVYLSNPKYNSNLVVFAEVEAASSAEKKFTGDIDGATTFYFVYNLNNLGSAAYSYIPYDTTIDHKTQKLSKDEQTTVIIDDIEDFKTDSAFLILQNDTTSSVYLVCGNSPLNPYGMDEKEIQYGKSAFYEIGGSGKGAIPFEKASELRAVINSSEYRELPKINYEAGKVYTVVVSKNAVERTNTTFFPSSGSVYEVAFANPKNPLQNKVSSFEEGTELSADDLAALSVDGYDFVGWYIGDKKIEEGFKIKQNYTLSAKLEAIEYTINYELNDGKNSTENPMSYTIESDSFSFAAPTRTGYKFSGWYETEDFTGSSTAGIESGNFGDKTLYAKWETVSYTISYVLNGGENSSENRSEYTIESDSITLASPSKTGATFLGWYETENFSGSKITSIPKGSVGNKTFYAKWNFITYSISYELNGGTNVAGNPTSYTTGSDTVAILNPTRSGYSFEGWYKTSDFSGNPVSEIESGSFGNITLYAKWDSTFTAERIADLDLSKISDAYTLKVVSDITSDTILELASKIKKASAVITLDLSEATGLTEIKKFGRGTYSDFSNCKMLKSVILPDCLEKLGEDAFQGCGSLESVVMPFGLKSIGNAVFAGCENLESIEIPGSVTEICDGAFCGCEKITVVVIPNSVSKIGNQSFLFCSNLESITIPSSVTEIGSEAFENCESLVSVTLPSSLTTIENAVFAGCKNLKEITIPNSVKSIGFMAFYGCESLESIILPKCLTIIESKIFQGCNNLKTITIPNSVTSICWAAFFQCHSLESVIIPASVTKIGSGSFQYCEKLQSITFADTSTWYYCGSSSYKNGTQISVGSPVANVKYFTSTYVNKYWYKE